MTLIEISLTIALVLLVAIPASAQGEELDEAEITHRSVVSMGDTARLQHVLGKARAGQPVVVSVIGGSITGGARASKVELQYGSRIAACWREQFPETEIRYVNAGIGATGSNIGAHRAELHLLKHKPDLVVVEYAVNDPNTELAAETLEGLVRQILKQPNSPAVILLFTMNRAGRNAQEWHARVGKHYGLPMASFRDALWPEIEAGRLKWEDVEADEVHPNDRGHGYCADFVTSIIAQVMASPPAPEDLPAISPLPRPLISDVFEFVAMHTAEDLKPASNQGWAAATEGSFYNFGPGWSSDQPGSTIEFEVEGTCISVIFHRIKGDMGIAEAQVDDMPPVKLNAWFGADWGGYTPWYLLGRHLAPGKHNVRVTLLEEKSEQSGGHHFEIRGIFAAGLREG